MKVYLSGPHGVGKTTFVNNLSIGRPLAKFVDTDLIDMAGIGREQQCERMLLFDEVIESAIHCEDVIVDRSPYDFEVYNSIVSMGDGFLDYGYRKLMDRFRKQEDAIVLGIIFPFEKMQENISKRNRGKWNENDEVYNFSVWNGFNRLYSRHPIKIVRYENLEEIVKELFFDHKI